MADTNFVDKQTVITAEWAQDVNNLVYRPVTQAQFDNSLAYATTAFVQRALGSFSSAVSYTAATVTLTAGDVGKAVVVSVGSTVTLPEASSVALGAVLFISATGTSDVVLIRAGGDTIIRNDSVSGSAFTVKAGTSVRLRQGNGGASWYVLDGDAALPFSSLFDSSIFSNGYQKLPSGLIIQWGVWTATTGGAALTFPITFPNACRVFVPGTVNGYSAVTVSSSVPTATGTTVYSASGSIAFNWIAIGF